MNRTSSINNVVEKCERLLADGYLEKAITLIFENRKNTDFENEIIALSRRNSELQNRTITNELDYSHIEIEKSRITVSLLIILSKIVLRWVALKSSSSFFTPSVFGAQNKCFNKN